MVKSVGRRLWWFVVSEEKPDGYFDVAQLHEAAGGLLFINLGTTSTIAASTSNDPNVWSGRALQEISQTSWR